jgi:thiol:disulfide interchange protein DsbA
MNSSFLLKYTLVGLTAIGFLLPVGLYAQALPKDPYADLYELITPPQPPTTAGKVEVAEFFLYTCPHCYAFEDDLNLWVEGKPSYIDFVKVPAVFNENLIVIGKVYYTAETLGVLPKLHTAIYKAIHQDNRKLSNEAEMMQLFAENGVSNDDFRKAFHSFSVDVKVRQAAMMTSKHGISGVPAMTVQGKYRLSSGKAGGHTQLLKLIDYLAQKESQLLTATPVQTPTTTPTSSEATPTPSEAKESAVAKDSPPAGTSEASPSTPATETVQTPASKEVKKDTAESPTPAEVKETSKTPTPAAEVKESSETPKPSDTPPSSDTQTKTTPQP